MPRTIAIAAEAAYAPGGNPGPWHDDLSLKDALEQRGHRVAIISWEDNTVDLLGRSCVHAVQKPPLFKGDQSRRRRVIDLDRLPERMLAFAQGLVGCLHAHFGEGALSRSRVDLFDQERVPILCELECVAPNTNISLVTQQRGRSAALSLFNAYAHVIEARAELLHG